MVDLPRYFVEIQHHLNKMHKPYQKTPKAIRSQQYRVLFQREGEPVGTMNNVIKLFSREGPPDELLSGLSNREVSLWLHRVPTNIDTEEFAGFAGLPWRDVYISQYDDRLPDALKKINASEFHRQRGYAHLIDGNPTSISLPPRSLPLYLLDASNPSETEFESTFRRMAMLGVLRQSMVRQVVVISDEDGTPPCELSQILDQKFRPFITFVSATDSGSLEASKWIDSGSTQAPLQLVCQTPEDFIRSVVEKYLKIYPSTSTIVRFRTADGSNTSVDLTDTDDVERPILNFYDLIQERDLSIVPPEALTEQEFADFFEGQQTSWRPYAARVPWVQDKGGMPNKLKHLLSRLDSVGSTENKIAFISSEPGAGGTTLARVIAFETASSGYPTLVAKPIPFTPDPLPIARYLTRSHHAFVEKTNVSEDSSVKDRQLYEAPWVIVFDRTHFENREADLLHFVNELTKSGRPAISLVVSGPTRPLEFYDSIAQEVTALTHLISPSQVESLGKHLNTFLRVHNKAQPLEEWLKFYQNHTVTHMGGIIAFWIALSFWLRRSHDITDSIQERIHDAFLEYGGTDAKQQAILEIAALSTERLSINEGLLPYSDNEWPLSHRLEDSRKNLSPLGLTNVNADGERYWGLAHDILGRLLINSVYHDFQTRERLGYMNATDAEHLRFLILKRIATRPEISENRYRRLAEQFATKIFKIDPDRGARAFAHIWREVLSALDDMPRLLHDTSRVFRHHTAISRRRISTLCEQVAMHNVTVGEKINLLERAIKDIDFAINEIERTSGDEPDMNLYNSLANAYLNLADAVASHTGDKERITELRQRASEATHQAYRENPTNPWVVETHIKNLLSIARSEPDRAVEASLDALLAMYDVLRTPDLNLRAVQLARLGEDALTILFSNTASSSTSKEPESALDVLVATWNILTGAEMINLDDRLAEIPQDLANKALTILEHPAGNGDVHVLKLRYEILSSARPLKFYDRLQLVENMQLSGPLLSPQLRLEYALLLYQSDRANDGGQEFHRLRELWRETEHFVHVPAPLNWLREGETEALRIVKAQMNSDQGYRYQARVLEFGRNALVPFRPEEFGLRQMPPGSPFHAHVSFGHNGPFLRPTNAGPRKG